MQILHFIKYTLDVDVLFYSENEMFHNFHIILDLKVHVKSFSRSLSMAIGQQIFAPLGQPPQSQRRCQRRIECPPYKISVSSWVIVFVVQKTLLFHTPFWSARLKCPVTLEFHDSIYQLLVNYKFSKVHIWPFTIYIIFISNKLELLVFFSISKKQQCLFIKFRRQVPIAHVIYFGYEIICC